MKTLHGTISRAALGVFLLLLAAGGGRADEAKLSKLNTGVDSTAISGYADTSAIFDVQAVPEPAALALLAAGGAAAGVLFRRQKKLPSGGGNQLR